MVRAFPLALLVLGEELPVEYPKSLLVTADRVDSMTRSLGAPFPSRLWILLEALSGFLPTRHYVSTCVKDLSHSHRTYITVDSDRKLMRATEIASIFGLLNVQSSLPAATRILCEYERR
jgi:hypothetical protein